MEQKEKAVAKKHFLSSKGQRITFIVLIVCVAICAALFSVLGVYMRKNSGHAVDYIGEKTMRESSYQLTQRFEMVMEQRLSMVKALETEYGSTESAEERERLAKSAKARGFTYLAFMRVNEELMGEPEDGRTMDFIFGDFIVTDLVAFRQSILDGKEKIAVGKQLIRDEAGKIAGYGEDMVMCGVPAYEHTMPDGKEKSMALVAGFSNKAFMEMLNINTEESKDITAYIIREDVLENGETNSFVLKRAQDAQYESFSELLRNEYSKADTATIIKELNASMRNDEVYSNLLHIDGHHVHMYCNALAKSEWYLVTLTDNNVLSEAIGKLNNQWVVMVVIAVAAIVLILIAIFVVYNHFNRQTLLQLDHARETAIRASKAKSEFLSNMSHDIRTPMNAIVGMTSIATTNIDNKQQVQDCLKKITLSSKHLLGLINDVLDMSKIESGKMTLNPESISLREIMDGIATIAQPQVKIKSQKFEIYIGDIITENVYCDSVRLNQVLINLLSNAIKFTSENGCITMALTQTESPVGENYVRNIIDVTDTGIGMTTDFMAHIFDSFTREDSARVHKTEGTGLGMTITKYIIDAMHGTIEVESELGKGSRFHIVLDFEKAATSEEEMVLPAWNMLVVDDDAQLCRSTVASLKEIGVCGEWTLSGEEAVEKAQAAQDDGKGYDAVLLDWKLPGIDGLETARRLRKIVGDGVPLLLISAYDWAELENDAHEAGLSGFIAKPLFKSTLYYGLHKFMQENPDAGAEKTAKSKDFDLTGLHILLAEDNDLNWEIAQMLLEEEGIVADRADNGKICVEMLSYSAPGTYQAILMDLRMPVMTGYEAAVAIRALEHPDKNLPIIAMTADAFADDVKKCLDCGMNAHISKPIDMDLLKSTLKKSIADKG